MNSLGKEVWERRGVGNLSKRAYIALISLFTIYGLAVSFGLALVTAHMWGPITQPKADTPVATAAVDPGSSAPSKPEAESHTPDAEKPEEEKSALSPTNKPTFGTWAFIVFGIVLPFAGIFIALGSDKPLISFLGYNMITVGFGLILGPTIYMYSAEIVLLAGATTFLLTVAMSVMGIIYPKSLEHWGGWLFGILLAVVIAQFSGLFLASLGYGAVATAMDHPIMHVLISILFCAYIIFDWNRALRIPYTVDNSIDTAVALYLDIINLFLHLLRLLGQSNSSSSS